MTHQCLNHCMVFHIHQEKRDALDLTSIAKEFAQNIFFSDIFIILDHIKIYVHAINNFIQQSIKIKSFSVYYFNISVAVQKRT